MADNVEALLREIRKKNTAKRRARMLTGAHAGAGQRTERKKQAVPGEPKAAMKTLTIVHESLFKSLKSTDVSVKHARRKSLRDFEEIASRIEGKNDR